MKQTARIISTYAADASGVCSALYELGGMSVIHDASGCNSTYNTHDEPRWYDFDSLVFISAISEMEAIMGDDEKLIDDLVDAAEQLNPRFVAVCGTPIPMMIGTDLHAIAHSVENRTGIPCFGIDTNGMHSYVQGASKAFCGLADRFVDRGIAPAGPKTVNILGMTPLDFSVNGSAEAIIKFLEDNGWTVISSWAMGSDLDDLAKSGSAAVNLVVSYSGFALAAKLRDMFGTPAVYGVPFGDSFSQTLLESLVSAENAGSDLTSYANRKTGRDITIIGESVFSESLAAQISAQFSAGCRVICTVETEESLLLPGDVQALDEDELMPLLSDDDIIIADPLYLPVCPKGARFFALPSEGFSGRLYRKDIPNLINVKLSNDPR